ncbi:MAG: ABC transporter ATP-binding protein [Thermodesulfobacteriota bacterium]
MAEEVYSLKGVSYGYNGDSTALSGINLSIRSGETVSILGANGSGKSTLLKILDGLIQPTKGIVSFHGRVLKQGENRADFRERVGFVFHEPDVQLFCATVFDELMFGPLQLDIPEGEAKKRAEDVMLMLGITGLRDRPPYSLSSGEKKKVAIASVLSVNPDVLLLDEPTNGLDPRTQVWLMELIGGLKKRGKTCVIATHDLSLAEDVSDRAVILGENHSVMADAATNKALGDKDLLLKANLIHEHWHRHGDKFHVHSHGPYSTHDEHNKG